MEGLVELLNQMNLLYTSTKIQFNGDTINSLNLLVPDEFVDELIEQISLKIDLRHKSNTISIIEVEGFVSTHLDRFKEKALKVKPVPNPIERLIESTDKYTNLNENIILFVIFATIIALAGLFLDNVAIVIGAMLLSPMLGPINAFAVNANLGRTKFIIKSQQTSLLLLSCIIATSFIITSLVLLFTPLSITEQIASRTQPTIIDMLLAIILGFAAGLALVTDFSELRVGVGVAVALVPPIAVTGIGLAMMIPSIAIGALLLGVINLLGLQLGCTILLNLKGVTPRRDYQKNTAKKNYKYFVYVIIVIMIILGIILLIQNKPV